MKIKSEQEMLKLGEEFARKCQSASDKPTVIELVGDVGAGKTTFTRGLAKGLGVKDAVTSPSFTISKAYALPQGGTLIHYDFYRLPDPGIMIDDLEDKLGDANNIIVIEWGESVADILPEKHFKVNIIYTDDGCREVEL